MLQGFVSGPPSKLAIRGTALLLMLGFSAALVPHPVCKVEGHEDDYDLAPLERGEEAAPYFATSPGGHYHYHFNFCGHASGCNQQPACQARMTVDSANRPKEDIATVTTTGELYLMKWTKMDNDDLDIVNNELQKQKIDKSYSDGLKVTYAIGPKQRKTVIRLPCDEDADHDYHEDSAEFQPADLQLEAHVVEKPVLVYNIIFPSKYACPKGVWGKKITIDPSKIVHSKSHFFGTLFLVLLALYCCGGCYYKRERLGAQGMEMIPHIDSITACLDTLKGAGSGDSAVGGMLNRARGVNDDGL